MIILFFYQSTQAHELLRSSLERNRVRDHRHKIKHQQLAEEAEDELNLSTADRSGHAFAIS